MFTEDLWNSWSKEEEKNYTIENGKRKYHKKGYLHLDHKFWFPDRKEELKIILKNDLKVYKKPLKRSEFWSFKPFLKILIKTPRYRYQELERQNELETKTRPICFASHIDSLIFGFYSFGLTKKYEQYLRDHEFDDCVLAYRSDLGLCNIQFAKEAFMQVQKRGSCTAIALDIKGYFDNIDHIILKEKWQRIWGGLLPEDQYRLYKRLTNYSYIKKDSFLRIFKGRKTRDEEHIDCLLDIVPGGSVYEKFEIIFKKRLIVNNTKPDKKTRRLKGIPQGSALSALLSNIYLIDFDKEIYDKSIKEGFIYRRYCDDLLLICDTDKSNDLKDFVIKKICADYFLTIQPAKVETIDFHENSKGIIRAFKRSRNKLNKSVKTNALNEKAFYKCLQYLGFEYNGENIYIRSSSLSRYFVKMRARIVKTVSMAYGASTKSNKIFLQQLFNRYSHFGERNFITYAYKASLKKYENSNGETKEGMDSISIRKQVSRHFIILKNNLLKKNEQRLIYKEKRNKPVTRKQV